MTSDSSSMSSLHPLVSPIHVVTIDGTSLSVIGRGTLNTSSFSVPFVAHVPKLTIQLMSVGQLTDYGCHVILDSDSCCVQDRRTGALIGTGPRRHDSHYLLELDSLHLSSVVAASLSASSTSASLLDHECLL
ncbi:hypothetical protein GUJ93_ZPchr0010g10613 [Zizania palustris]|uniref:Retrovirus-related Pol polyprotein from transposon TNT 1-94-like beta-barrel domain-containing protein n=1 Tax=Zizania palustris TaxID=103762 RepID=A0A8J5W9H4_ZIZPA|nr:hypothetical protein GUJ93_ZPchr0010g10613 [Zizania palustris]